MRAGPLGGTEQSQRASLRRPLHIPTWEKRGTLPRFHYLVAGKKTHARLCASMGLPLIA